MPFKTNMTPLLFYCKRCAAFRSHWLIQTGVTVRKRPIWVKFDYFKSRVTLLSIIKLYASFHHHIWIQTGVTVRKRLSWVVTSVTLTFEPWPWPFAWTLPWSLVITPENFMIRWREHSQKGVTDGRTDGRTYRRTENTIQRAAWSQLKILFIVGLLYSLMKINLSTFCKVVLLALC